MPSRIPLDPGQGCVAPEELAWCCSLWVWGQPQDREEGPKLPCQGALKKYAVCTQSYVRGRHRRVLLGVQRYRCPEYRIQHIRDQIKWPAGQMERIKQNFSLAVPLGLIPGLAFHFWLH